MESPFTMISTHSRIRTPPNGKIVNSRLKHDLSAEHLPRLSSSRFVHLKTDSRRTNTHTERTQLTLMKSITSSTLLAVKYMSAELHPRVYSLEDLVRQA